MSSLDFAGKTVESISEFDRRVYESLSKGQWLPNAFKQYLVEYLALNQPLIPVGQLVGFSQTTPRLNVVGTTESTTSASYTDLATVGPSVAGLADGQYLFWGLAQALANNAVSRTAGLGINVNGTVSDESNATFVLADGLVTMYVFAIVSASAGSNTVKLQYKTSAETTSFQTRVLVGIRTGNL